MPGQDQVYLGNPLLKKANVAQEFTKEQILSFILYWRLRVIILLVFFAISFSITSNILECIGSKNFLESNMVLISS